jgi:riboflavin kinase/FMN adenylyltransferase
VGGEGFLVEAHLFDFEGDLYGRRLEVEFIEKLRDEAHFEVLDDLVVQMREDERQARVCLSQNVN